MVLQCIDDMLKPKFKNITFYAHNLGKFDSVFITSVLLRFNETPEGKINPYKLSCVFRDADQIKLVIRRKDG